MVDLARASRGWRTRYAIPSIIGLAILLTHAAELAHANGRDLRAGNPVVGTRITGGTGIQRQWLRNLIDDRRVVSLESVRLTTETSYEVSALVTLKHSMPLTLVQSRWEALLVLADFARLSHARHYPRLSRYRIIVHGEPRNTATPYEVIRADASFDCARASAKRARAEVRQILARAGIVTDLMAATLRDPRAFVAVGRIAEAGDYLNAIGSVQSDLFESRTCMSGLLLTLRTAGGATVGRFGFARRLEAVAGWVRPDLLGDSGG